MSEERVLSLTERRLAAGSEWLPSHLPGWILIQVREGVGYWLGGGTNLALEEGDLLLCGGGGEGRFRCSHVRNAVLRSVYINLETVQTLVSLCEHRALSRTLRDLNAKPERYPNGSGECERFVAEAEHVHAGATFQERCRWVSLWADLVAKRVGAEATTPLVSDGVRQRFDRCMGSFTEAELLSKPLKVLVQQCGCSARHFARLFRLRFGKTLRQSQIEWRLLKARRLLEESDEKIINVANESGFAHLGLFNRLFRTHFGMTPSAWRERRQRAAKARRRSAAT